MNALAAAIIMSKTSLTDFLGMAPDERLDEFGLLVGEHRVKRLNDWIMAKQEAQIDSSSQSVPE